MLKNTIYYSLYYIIIIFIIQKRLNVTYTIRINKLLTENIILSSLLYLCIIPAIELVNNICMPKNISINNIYFTKTCILAPIFEEILFRGIIFSYSLKKTNIYYSIIYTSLLFSIMHHNVYKIISTFILGLILNILYYKSNNLINNIYIHMLHNSLIFILLQSKYKSFFFMKII